MAPLLFYSTDSTRLLSRRVGILNLTVVPLTQIWFHWKAGLRSLLFFRPQVAWAQVLLMTFLNPAF
jgi:hypothetical protein